MLEAGNPCRHEWKNLEGKPVESTSNFSSFKGIILEDGNKQSIVVPLMLEDESAQLSILERNVQSVSKQINWTNTALRGMATHTFVTNDYA